MLYYKLFSICLYLVFICQHLHSTLYLFSVIAAVKNEHSVEDLSTPYKKILLNQIQQHLTSPLPTMPGSPQLPVSDQLSNNEESGLSQSFDSAMSHRKKGIPCKYVASDGDAYSCDRCEKSFADQDQFEQHSCFYTPVDVETEDLNSVGTLSNTEAFSCDRCEKYFENQQLYEQHECVSMSPKDKLYESQACDEEFVGQRDEELSNGEKPMEEDIEVTDSPSEKVDDVISAISAKAEAVGSSSSIKGSAIAQVISGLLGANKQAPNNNGNSSNMPSVHRQSIST